MSRVAVVGIGHSRFGRRTDVNVAELAWLEGVDYEKAKPGIMVRVEGRTSKEGNSYYVFVPA
ncbi:MAG: hypothetical protein ABR867_05640 [Nitrososphaerales archaeon]|jgi:hypothetical protein